MATVLFLNNYQTTLGAALSSTATTMTVSSTTGLPSSLASGQFIPMTLTPASSPGSDYEIVYVTGISGSTLTVERGQEGTSALNWNTGDILYSTNTAQTTGASMGSPSTDFQTNALTASGLITANDGINITTSGPFTGLPCDIASGISGPIAGSQYVLYFDAVREVNIPANFSGSLASVLTAFTDAATYTIYHNGTSVGTISFAASGTSGTFSTSSAFTLAVGDNLTIQAPSTADATAANLAITILANLA